MFWPTVVSHKIDDESPLWEFSARNIARFAKKLNHLWTVLVIVLCFTIDQNADLFGFSQTFEIILTLEGITPETGNTIQVDPLNQIRLNYYYWTIFQITPKHDVCSKWMSLGDKINYIQVRTSYLPNEIIWGFRWYFWYFDSKNGFGFL